MNAEAIIAGIAVALGAFTFSEQQRIRRRLLSIEEERHRSALLVASFAANMTRSGGPEYLYAVTLTNVGSSGARDITVDAWRAVDPRYHLCSVPGSAFLEAGWYFSRTFSISDPGPIQFAVHYSDRSHPEGRSQVVGPFSWS